MSKPHFTVGEAARHLGVELWRVRRIADELDADLPRAGQYRLIPESLIPRISERLRERGWLPTQVAGGRS
jgi:hypothetical protein